MDIYILVYQIIGHTGLFGDLLNNLLRVVLAVLCVYQHYFLGFAAIAFKTEKTFDQQYQTDYQPDNRTLTPLGLSRNHVDIPDWEKRNSLVFALNLPDNWLVFLHFCFEVMRRGSSRLRISSRFVFTASSTLGNGIRGGFCTVLAFWSGLITCPASCG